MNKELKMILAERETNYIRLWDSVLVCVCHKKYSHSQPFNYNSEETLHSFCTLINVRMLT